MTEFYKKITQNRIWRLEDIAATFAASLLPSADWISKGNCVNEDPQGLPDYISEINRAAIANGVTDSHLYLYWQSVDLPGCNFYVSPKDPERLTLQFSFKQGPQICVGVHSLCLAHLSRLVAKHYDIKEHNVATVLYRAISDMNLFNAYCGAATDAEAFPRGIDALVFPLYVSIYGDSCQFIPTRLRRYEFILQQLKCDN